MLVRREGRYHGLRFTRALVIGSLAGGASVGTLHAGAVENHVRVVAVAVDDQLFPDSAYFVELTVELPQVVETVLGVTLTSPSGGPVVLSSEEPGVWEQEIDFDDFASMKTMLDGDWTITIDLAGLPANVSTFGIDLATLTESDFFGTAEVLTPAHGSIGQAPDVTFTWTDPTEAATPDAVFVNVDSNTSEQADNSLDGSLTVKQTSWTPPLALSNGEYEFGVAYFKIDDALRASTVVTGPGPITWGDSPFAPDTYTSAAPLLAFGSETIIGFSVGIPCPGDVNGDGAVGFPDLLAILANWGCSGDCAEDVDGDHFVGFSDLLSMLASWGPCAV